MRGVKMRYSPNLLMCGIETDLITTDYNKINGLFHFIIRGFYFYWLASSFLSMTTCCMTRLITFDERPKSEVTPFSFKKILRA